MFCGEAACKATIGWWRMCVRISQVSGRGEIRKEPGGKWVCRYQVWRNRSRDKGAEGRVGDGHSCIASL